MRIPASKVYRAFPELDRFSGEQCERFMIAARRGARQRTVRVNLQILFTLLTLAAGGALYWLFIRTTGYDPRKGYSPTLTDTFFALAMTFELAAGGFVWLLTKDWLLRRRIRRVLNTRGSCTLCGYTMAGLRVGADLYVTCPECGNRLAADESLGEVAPDTSGVNHFLPSPDIVPAFERWFTPARVRTIWRVVIGVPAVLVVLALVSWGGYEWFLHRQALKARADRTGVRVLRELCEQNQPRQTPPDSPDAWDIVSGLVAQMARAEIREMREGPVTYPAALRPDFTVLVEPPGWELDAEQTEQWHAAGKLAVALIDEYRVSGILKAVDALADCRRAVRTLSDPNPGEPPFMLPRTEMAGARKIAWLNAARLKLAAEAGDLTEFTSALASSLGLARAIRRGPMLADRQLADMVESVTDTRVKESLVLRPGREWVNAIRREYDRQRDEAPALAALKGQRSVALDTAAWLFSEPSRVRAGRYSTVVKGMIGDDRERWLGTYRGSRRAIDALYDRAEVMIAQEPWQRPGVWLVQEGIPDTLLIETLFQGSANHSLRMEEHLMVRRRGMELLLAVERFRVERDEYPERLADLVPGTLAALPLDPYSGMDFVYTRSERRDYRRFTFILYSVGADGTDDGGAVSQYNDNALWPSSSGFDYVIGPARAGIPTP